jgi:FkbM family methyltransferase
MIITLRKGLRADIGNDYSTFWTVHGVFYLDQYGSLSIKSSDVVLDCGAHIGLFTLKAANMCSRVVSVEPSSTNFRLLQRNVILNGLEKKVTLIKKAVLARSGLRIPLFLFKSGRMNSVYQKSYEDRFEIVETVSLDDLSRELSLSFDCIKIDVEGAELEVLKGGNETLKRTREVILEYHSEELLRQCQKLLTSYGFNCSIVKPKRLGNIRWLLGYILLNYRLIRAGQKPDFIVRQYGRKSHEIGILYACKYH